MDTMSTKMYTALKSAGAPEENAKEGVPVLCELYKKFAKLEAGHRLTHGMVSLNIMLSMLVIGFFLTQ
ncbi:hypothetical protein BMS3Bbin14_01067 [bacterium BMS3Bbin14]|nr:hypothetical protein BMS3Abin13_01879 [bacterium BMS3Abin13]GBE52593.1 hypothetical protein BMS3Bbin14_01067 [bacterium BMS3Bbin14]HDO31432.1 hypothetical protein [Desulfobacteraceae bacterium]